MNDRGERQKDVTSQYRVGWDAVWGPKADRPMGRPFAELAAEWEKDPDNIGDGTMGSRSPMPAIYEGRSR